MVSVVIPLYNNASTIERAIRSVLRQTMPDFELIIVDDGSTDGGAEVVKAIEDSRIQLITQPNRGVSSARNQGIKAAKCKWVAFLDADDEWKPQFLETVLSLSQKYPECQICATAYERQIPNGETQWIVLNNIPNSDDFVLTNYFEVAATSDPPFCSICVMAQLEALKTIGGFPENIHQGEDLLTWARLSVKNRIAYSVKPQSVFHTGYNYGNSIPKRVPPEDDIVGQELEKLYQENKATAGLPLFIAQWHKMRASMFLRLEDSGKKCRNEIRKSLRWHRNNKLILYLLLSFLPLNFRMKIISKSTKR